jgi:hypothetical protein
MMDSIGIAIASLDRARGLRPPSEEEAREAFERLWSEEERLKHSTIGRSIVGELRGAGTT